MPLPVEVVETISWVGRISICAQPTLSPVLIQLTGNANEGLTFNPVPEILFDRGWTVLSPDLPGHGLDIRNGESSGQSISGLLNWGQRILNGEDIVFDFCQRMRYLIANLISNNIAASGRIAIAGQSRGGFMAIHAMARSPQIKAGVALSPVTNLPALTEFNTGVHSAAATHRLTQLLEVGNAFVGGRPLWVAIGSNDTRVSTIDCTRNMGEIMNSAGDVNNKLEYYTGKSAVAHGLPVGMEAQAADWLVANVP